MKCLMRSLNQLKHYPKIKILQQEERKNEMITFFNLLISIYLLLVLIIN
jgi:hypothetical protein